MRILHPIVHSVVLAALLILATAATKAADPAIVGGSIIDATQTGARENRTILIERGRMVRIGPTDEVNVPDVSRADREHTRPPRTSTFRGSFPHHAWLLSTLQTPRYRDARKTRSRLARYGFGRMGLAPTRDHQLVMTYSSGVV